MANPRLWDTAMKLAGGDAKRITIISTGCLEVLVNENEPKPIKEKPEQVIIPEPPAPEPRKRTVAKPDPFLTQQTA